MTLVGNGFELQTNDGQMIPELLLDLQNYCRLCLQRGGPMAHIFESPTTFQFAVRIMACASLEVQPNDQLPHSVCLDCQQELDRSYAFRMQCRQVEAKLKDHLRLFTAGIESNLFDESAIETTSSDGGDPYDGEQQLTMPTASIDPALEQQQLDESPIEIEYLEEVNERTSPLLAMDEADDHRTDDGIIEILDDGAQSPAVTMACYEALEFNQEPAHDVSRTLECPKGDRMDEIAVEQTKDETVTVRHERRKIGRKRREMSQYYKLVQTHPDDASMPPMRYLSNRCLQVTLQTNDGANMELLCYGIGKTCDPIIHDTATLHKIGRGKGYFCEMCYKWNSSKTALARHQRIHTGEKPFTCDLCDKRFVQKEILKRHILRHLSRVQFPCDQCSKSFQQEKLLLAHTQRFHSRSHVIVFRCVLCGKEFKHSSGMSRHLAAHMGRWYECAICNRKFTDRSAKRRHEVNVHR